MAKKRGPGDLPLLVAWLAATTGKPSDQTIETRAMMALPSIYLVSQLFDCRRPAQCGESGQEPTSMHAVASKRKTGPLPTHRLIRSANSYGAFRHRLGELAAGGFGSWAATHAFSKLRKDPQDQETVWGAVGYQISVSHSSSSAGSTLRGVADNGWKVGGGDPSPLGWEATDPIVIRTSKWDASGRKIKIAAAEIQGRLKNFQKRPLTPSSPHLFRSSPGA